VCVSPNDSLKAWWRFDDSLVDQLQTLVADTVPPNTTGYVSGVAGHAWFSQPNGYIDTHDGDRLLSAGALTVAAWLKPGLSQFGESGTIVSKPAQYRIARYPDGTLRWAFNQNGVLAWVNTGIVIPANVWTHVAVTYDGGFVNTYVNGHLAHTQQLAGTLTTGPNPTASLTIAGRPDASAFYS